MIETCFGNNNTLYTISISVFVVSLNQTLETPTSEKLSLVGVLRRQPSVWLNETLSTVFANFIHDFRIHFRHEWGE